MTNSDNEGEAEANTSATTAHVAPTSSSATSGPADSSAIDQLAHALQRLTVRNEGPSTKLPKFSGECSSTDVDLEEFLEDFDSYCARHNVPQDKRASYLVSHLTGAAKAEILCIPKEQRNLLENLKAALRQNFGVGPRNIFSAQQQFYSRRQRDGETLQEFSRALRRLYDRYAQSTVDPDGALSSMRDMTLITQFTHCCREQYRLGIKTLAIREDCRTFTDLLGKAVELFDTENQRSHRTDRERTHTSVRQISQSCGYCGLAGHVARDCRKRKREESAPESQILRQINELTRVVESLKSENARGRMQPTQPATLGNTSRQNVRPVRGFGQGPTVPPPGHIQCTRCGRRNHEVASCKARYHVNGQRLGDASMRTGELAGPSSPTNHGRSPRSAPTPGNE